MFTSTYDGFTLLCKPDGLPDLYPEYVQRATFVDEGDLSPGIGSVLFVAVRRGMDWPFLVIARRYYPDVAGFHPGVLFIPETKLLFLGAGERVSAYRLEPPAKLWEDGADTGFWSWDRRGDTILMAAELELAAWDMRGKKLWTTFVEPPWSYDVEGGIVHLDVMGTKSSFPLTTGPERP